MKQTDTSTEITGRFFRQLYRSADGSYCVCLYTHNRETFTVVGSDLPEVTFPVTFVGQWKVDAKYGKQFVVDMIVNQLPSAGKDICQYIASLKIGIGVKRAEKMLNLVGLDNFWTAIEQDPMQFCAVKGIDSKTVLLLKDALSKMAAQQGLFKLLAGDLSCDSRQYKKICNFFSNNTALMLDSIQENPFVLMKCGYTFEELDYYSARHTHYPVNDYRRLLAATQQALLDARQESHVGLPSDVLIEKVSSLLSKQAPVGTADIVDFLDGASCEQSIIHSYGLYYLPRAYKEESRIAELLVEQAKRSNRNLSRKKFEKAMAEYSQDKGFVLSDDQQNAVWEALTRSICIITGGPGTGKSTILDALLFCWKKFYDEEWLLMAPTGKAAVRMTETTQQPAATIHSSLGLQVNNDSIDELNDQVASIYASLIIVDETSMIDQSVMTSLEIALQNGSDSKKTQHLVLVGDPDQLPSVGWGNVLADLIESGVIPVRRLTTIYRQGAGNPIITNAARIQSGSTELDFTQKSFRRGHYGSDEANKEEACKFYLKCVQHYGIENVALLSPYHRATAISTIALNQQLQEAINPNRGQGEVKFMGTAFRTGDRVMQLKNTDTLSNGDVGTIAYADPNAPEEDPCVFVKFENGVTCEYTRDNLKQLELAYATSIHKSQGSQWPVVITILPNRFTTFLRRNLLYTAITRSSQNVAIISPLETIRKCIENNKKDDRYTRLRLRLQELLKEQKAA